MSWTMLGDSTGISSRRTGSIRQPGKRNGKVGCVRRKKRPCRRSLCSGGIVPIGSQSVAPPKYRMPKVPLGENTWNPWPQLGCQVPLLCFVCATGKRVKCRVCIDGRGKPTRVVRFTWKRGINKFRGRVIQSGNASWAMRYCPELILGPDLVAAIFPEVEQLSKTVQATSALQEVMADQFRRTGTRLDVHAEAD